MFLEEENISPTINQVTCGGRDAFPRVKLIQLKLERWWRRLAACKRSRVVEPLSLRYESSGFPVKDLSLIFASTERRPGAGVRQMFQLFKMGALQYDWLAITRRSSIAVAVYVLFRGRVKNNDWLILRIQRISIKFTSIDGAL